MGKIDFNSFVNNVANREDSNEGRRAYINNFKLANDGDEAVVRIMLDDMNDLDIYTKHNVNYINNNGKKVYRGVSCVKSNFFADDCECPLCAIGNKAQTKCFVRMLQYVKGENGTIEVVPVIWERNYRWIQKLQSYIDNYGPLSTMCAKVIRHGKAGDLQTDYELIPNLNPNVYNESNYPINKELFNGFDLTRNTVLVKTFDEIKYFTEHNAFPDAVPTGAPKVEYSETNGFNVDNDSDTIEWNTAGNDAEVQKPRTTQRMPWETNNSSPRPTRY